MAFSSAVVAALIPGVGTAHHNCVSNVSILSRAHESGAVEEPAVNPHELVVCPAGADDAADTRLILPGTNQVSIRYSPSQAPTPASPPVTAQLSGLLSGSVVLSPKEVLPGIFTYASAWMALPGGAHGSITAAVSSDSTTYHTL